MPQGLNCFRPIHLSAINFPNIAAVKQQLLCRFKLETLIFSMDFGMGEWAVFKLHLQRSPSENSI